MKFVRKVIVGGTAPTTFLQGLEAALPKTAEDEGLAGGGQSAPEHRTCERCWLPGHTKDTCKTDNEAAEEWDGRPDPPSGGQEIMAEEPAATEEAAANSPEYGVGADSPEYGVGAGGAAREATQATRVDSTTLNVRLGKGSLGSSARAPRR